MASSGAVALTPEEAYRVSRIQIARELGINPPDVDAWDTQTYYDYLAVDSANKELSRLL